MPEPIIEIIPLQDGCRSDGATLLDVLVRITPPTPEVHFVRPSINLGLVLDRSGSMAGARKIQHAHEAAIFAVNQLLPTDRLSLTIFDGEVETIAPNAPAVDKAGLIRQIQGIRPRGATALHAGWAEGGRQVEGGFLADGLNRVILLSDGLANEGVTDPNAIAADSRALANRGVSTTTMGLGDDYNEDLMQAMGQAGDGNYYYIESPVQLVDIFHTELMGLMANLGQKVSLGIEPTGGAAVAEVLNDLSRNDLGRLMLPNLVVGMPISVVVRLTVPALTRGGEVCRFRLAWDDPKGERRSTLYSGLSLEPHPSSEWEMLPANPAVAEQVALLMAARAKQEAIQAYDRGDFFETRGLIDLAHAQMVAMPCSPGTAEEIAALEQLKEHLAQGDGAKFRKRSAFQAFTRKRGHDS